MRIGKSSLHTPGYMDSIPVAITSVIVLVRCVRKFLGSRPTKDKASMTLFHYVVVSSPLRPFRLGIGKDVAKIGQKERNTKRIGIFFI